MKVLVLMAGRGSRFSEAGYCLPKPLLPIKDKFMIQCVVDNLNLTANYVFLTLQEHYNKYNLKTLLSLICKGDDCKIIQVDQITEGAACTALLATQYINNDEELLIVNSDQLIDWNAAHFLKYMRERNADGGILTFIASGKKWSFVRINEEDGQVLEVAEKKEISNIGTIGIYYIKRGRDFVNAANQMISKNIRTNNEFYVAPTFNEMIEEGKKIYHYPVPRIMALGTPVDYEKYLENLK